MELLVYILFICADESPRRVVDFFLCGTSQVKLSLLARNMVAVGVFVHNCVEFSSSIFIR